MTREGPPPLDYASPRPARRAARSYAFDYVLAAVLIVGGLIGFLFVVISLVNNAP